MERPMGVTIIALIAFFGGFFGLCVPILTNVTFYQNSAVFNGGGIHNAPGASSTIIDAILLENPPNQISGVSTITYSDIEGGYSGTGNINKDPLLGLLADNGGFKLAHALEIGSPAIDAGDPATCPATDQRGFPRPYDGDDDGVARCDMGAYEYGMFEMYLPLVMSEQ